MDVEEYVRRRLVDGTDENALKKSLADHIIEIKNVQPSYASAFAQAVIDEVKNTRGLTGDFFELVPAHVHMGEFGVGSRGKGDFYAHRQIARIIGKTSASVGVDEMDDAGAVCAGGNYNVCTVD
jgi:hydrogenase expression/formation protein